jgi:hypothetical protein
LRQRDHLGLHHALHGAGDFDDEFLGLAARFYLRVACRFFKTASADSPSIQRLTLSSTLKLKFIHRLILI